MRCKRDSALAWFLLIIATSVTAKRHVAKSMATRLAVEIPIMEGCKNVPRNAVIFHNVSLSMIGRADYALNGMFEIIRAATEISEIILNIKRCRDHVSANTCEHFQTWRFNKDVCTMFFSPNSQWNKFKDAVTPTPECPSKVGMYKVQNATLDMRFVQSLPLPWEGNVWLVRFLMNERKNMVHTCTDTELKFHRVRNV